MFTSSKLTDKLRKIVLVLSLLIFIACGVQLALIYLPTDDTPKLPIDSDILFDDYEAVKDDFHNYVIDMKAQNSDVWGFISIKGTKIHYPVLYYTDNDFYLTHNFYKKFDRHGALFVDTYTDFQRSDNWIIYGHNMKDGTMFAGLHKFTNRKYFDAHSTIFFATLEESAIYDIFAVVPTQINAPGDNSFAYYQYVNIVTEQEYNTYVSNMKKLSSIKTDITPKYGEQLITFSTCVGTSDTKRLVVVARKRTVAQTDDQ